MREPIGYQSPLKTRGPIDLEANASIDPKLIGRPFQLIRNRSIENAFGRVGTHLQLIGRSIGRRLGISGGHAPGVKNLMRTHKRREWFSLVRNRATQFRLVQPAR